MRERKTGALRGLFRLPTRSPLWNREGVFIYPPQSLWSPLDGAEVTKAWKEAARRPSSLDSMGLYVHIPSEIGYIGEFFPSDREHPYLESMEREVERLKLPTDLPIRSVYIGSGGAGSLSSLRADEIRRLLGWLRRRFRLTHLRQTNVELDAAELTGEKVSALAAGRVDRVASRVPHDDGTPAASARRESFAEGIRLCRKRGIRNIALDVVAGRPGAGRDAAEKDLAFAKGLAPDNFFLCDYSRPDDRDTAESVRRVRSRMDVKRSDAEDVEVLLNNLQLGDVWRCNASILGLGWGAVSHIRCRMVYAKSGSCFMYVDGLLRRQAPNLTGAPLDEKREMRAHVIRALEDVGRIDAETFRLAFKWEPEEVFRDEFAGLLKEKRLERRGSQYHVRPSDEQERYVCSLRFYGTDILRSLAGRKGTTPAREAFADPEAYVPLRRKQAELVRLNEVGMRHARRGEPDRALACFDKALELDRRDYSTWINKGAAASMKKDWEAALASYAEAVRLRPGGVGALSDALSARASVLLRLGREKEALRDIEKALGEAPEGWPRREKTERELLRLLRRRRSAKSPQKRRKKR